jgi:hypothetical protein
MESVAAHRAASHVRYAGLHPRLRASTYTMPHRLMVAGLAYWRSATCPSAQSALNGKLGKRESNHTSFLCIASNRVMAGLQWRTPPALQA